VRALLIMFAVVAVDQLSKHLLEGSLRPGSERKLVPGLALVNTRNRGVAFGVEPGSSVAVSVIIALALLALLVYFLRHSTRPLIWLPTGLLFGGAIGNVIDRARQGAVTDFIKLPLGWPPFNLADASITIGVLILILLLARTDSHGREPPVTAASTTGDGGERAQLAERSRDTDPHWS
jgi:signal peptidase II